jgi:hypothetical protein
MKCRRLLLLLVMLRMLMMVVLPAQRSSSRAQGVTPMHVLQRLQLMPLQFQAWPPLLLK